MDIEELTQKVHTNMQKIEDNAQKIDSNANKIQQNSYALEILKDYKKANKRLYITLIIMMVIWVITILVFHI